MKVKIRRTDPLKKIKVEEVLSEFFFYSTPLWVPITPVLAVPITLSELRLPVQVCRLAVRPGGVPSTRLPQRRSGAVCCTCKGCGSIGCRRIGRLLVGS